MIFKESERGLDLNKGEAEPPLSPLLAMGLGK